VTDPIKITGDYVVAADDSLLFTNVDYAFQLDEELPQESPSLEIFGSVQVRSTDDTRVVYAIEDRTGAFTDHELSVWIHSGAHFSLEMTGAHGAASGIRLANAGSTIVNDGVFSVVSAVSAQGVFGGGSFTNTGRFSVEGQTEASLVYFNGTVANSGLLTVNSAQDAYGAYFMTVGEFHNDGKLFVTGSGAIVHGVEYFLSSALLDNTGRVIVRDASGADGAIGVYLHQANAVDITNSGVLKADTAILVEDTTAAVDLHNAGKISGAVVLGAEADAVANSGKIAGDIELGGGDDSYDGARGSFNGALQGGAGADTIVGGRAGELIYGDGLKSTADDGADTITGNGGADTIQGGGGGDVFVYSHLSDSTEAHADLIRGLSEKDVLDLSKIDADAASHGNQVFHLVDALGGHAGELALAYDAGSGLTILVGDVDGDGAADLTITIAGDHRDFDHFVL
jgi:hypothetical protein